MVALMIFLVVSIGLLPLLHGNLRSNQGRRLQAEARRLASEAMAGLQVVDYAKLALVSEQPWRRGPIEVRQHIEPGVPRTGQSRITVTTLWQLQGEARRYQLQTIRSVP
jgi:hypothetical protein